MLLRAAQVLRRVHGEPEPSWRYARSLPSAASSGNVLVSWSPLLGKPRERFLAEDVDAAVDPVGMPRGLAGSP